MKKISWLGAVCIVIAAILWAVEGIVFLPSLYHLDVGLVVFLLHAFGFAYMLFILIWERKELSKMDKKDWGAFFLVALLGGSIGTLAITKALFFVNFVPLSIVVLLQKLQPVFAILLAIVILKERPPRIFYLYALLALFGAYLITFGFNVPNLDVGDKLFQAASLALLAAFAFGAGTVFGKRALQKVNFRVGTSLRFGLTMLIMALAVTAFGTWGDLTKVTSADIRTFVLIAVTTSGFGIFFYYYGLKKVLASQSTILELAYPAAAILLDYFLHGTILSWAQWLGIIILLLVTVRISFLTSKPEKQTSS